MVATTHAAAPYRLEALAEQCKRPACGGLVTASLALQSKQKLKQRQGNGLHAIRRFHDVFSPATMLKRNVLVALQLPENRIARQRKCDYQIIKCGADLS